MKMEYNIIKRRRDIIVVTAEIDADKNTPESVKLGRAVIWALENGVDLTYADLSGADLRDADLRDADVPRIVEIHREVYEAASREGALDMSEWHSGDTTHSRAGWVVTLAAAALIYIASDPSLKAIPDFHASEEEAMADMKRMAEAEANAA